MNIFFETGKHVGFFGFDLTKARALNCFLGLCSTPQDFKDLRLMSKNRKVQKKIDQSWDNFVLEYVRREIPKCKKAEDFRNLDEEIIAYAKYAMSDGSAIAHENVYKAWAKFVEPIKIEEITEEITKCKTFNDFRKLLSKFPTHTKKGEYIISALDSFMTRAVIKSKK